MKINFTTLAVSLSLQANKAVAQNMRKVVALVSSIIVLSGCSAQAGPREKTEITILAAASLTEVFNELEESFEAENTDIDLRIMFAGSASLANQIKEGAVADIYVSANEAYMNEMVSENYIKEEDVKIFAYNQLIVMVYKGAKDKISSMEDLIGDDITILLAEDAQPIGKYTRKMLDKIHQEKLYSTDYVKRFEYNVISYENSVKAVVAKIEIGEAHCGIAYVTDITKANALRVVAFDVPDECNQKATFAIGKLAQSKKGAEKFVDYILGEKGQKKLEKYKFLLP